MFRSLVTKHFVCSYRDFCHAAIFIQTDLSSGEKFVITILLQHSARQVSHRRYVYA